LACMLPCFLFLIWPLVQHTANILLLSAQARVSRPDCSRQPWLFGLFCRDTTEDPPGSWDAEYVDGLITTLKNAMNNGRFQSMLAATCEACCALICLSACWLPMLVAGWRFSRHAKEWVKTDGRATGGLNSLLASQLVMVYCFFGLVARKHCEPQGLVAVAYCTQPATRTPGISPGSCCLLCYTAVAEHGAHKWCLRLRLPWMWVLCLQRSKGK
jgi:hypothetical protein